MAESFNFLDCPCSGKDMTYFAAPWILLALHNHQGSHGYEIRKLLEGYMEDLRFSLNITGLYRHLKVLEKRGILFSQWDTPVRGPAKRKYYLADLGTECLWQWIQTLSIQMELIGRFFQKAKTIFPSTPLLKISYPVRTKGPFPSIANRAKAGS